MNTRKFESKKHRLEAAVIIGSGFEKWRVWDHNYRAEVTADFEATDPENGILFWHDEHRWFGWHTKRDEVVSNARLSQVLTLLLRSEDPDRGQDVTHKVEFQLPDDEDLPLTQCVCETAFPAWSEIVHMDRANPWKCRHCGAQLVFTSGIRVFRVDKNK